MCGRAAYSARAISAAAAALSNRDISKEVMSESIAAEKSAHSEDAALELSSILPIIPSEEKDRPNTGPGHEYHIFRRSKNDIDAIECTPSAIWGLIPNNGTHHSPHLLPTDPEYSVTPHYTMFNARSETIYDKKSFSGLIRNGQTCIFAVEGYYEWTKPQSLDKKKQPYIVRPTKNQQQPLLLAGLWSCVKTGRRIKDANTKNMEDETITTFTILTTDAHPDYTWLHPRQPVMLWDISIALEWLMRPNPKVVEKLCSVPIRGSISKDNKQQSTWETSLSVYPVSNKINDGRYQGDDCMVEVKLKKVPSIKSFFGEMKKAKTEKEVIGSSELPPHAVLETTSTPKRCPTPERTELRNSMLKGASQEIESKEKLWTCSQCTFIHTGPGKFEYLACELCGTERIDCHNTDSPEVFDDSDRGRKRKARR
mmetsp:Transcript_1109/g.2310  ORF Transcript_1109/g.2310 Transcript_1109/m.2310 type:complete len:425 (-) Transcript_1109:71-1345(-)